MKNGSLLYDLNMKKLVEFWKSISADSPYVHPDDFQAIEQRLKKYVSYEKYIKAYGNSQVTDTDLHAGLLPVPYVGDIHNAKIYILMLNPGFSHDDYIAEKNQDFKKALRKNILQKNSYPFFYLDPRFLWTGGGRYWERRFREYAKKLVSQSKKPISYGEALKIISEKVVCLELSPYHSRKNGLGKNILENMKSTKKIVEFAQNYVLEKARAGQAGIIVARGNPYWQLQKGKNVVVYRGQA